MDIDERVVEIIKILEDHGYKTLIVGGAVRDSLLNLRISDYDLATNASLKSVKNLFKKTASIYRNNLLWALKVENSGLVVEISRFRQEKAYKDRLPQKITYVDNFKDDVLRRDFTINAIGYSLQEGYLDYVGGILDLNNKIIKVIGNPQKRFQEDPLRILRAIRLAANLNFKIEKTALKFIQKNYQKALIVKSDQVANELIKILAASGFDDIYQFFTNLFADISQGEFKNIKINQRQHLLDKNNLTFYLLYLLKIDQNNIIFDYLKINASIVEKISKLGKLIELLGDNLTYEKMVLAFIDYGQDQLVFTVNILQKFDLLSQNNLLLFKEVIDKGYLKISDLKISITDFDDKLTIQKQYEILEKLQKEVIAHKIENDRILLLKRLKSLLKVD